MYVPIHEVWHEVKTWLCTGIYCTRCMLLGNYQVVPWSWPISNGPLAMYIHCVVSALACNNIVDMTVSWNALRVFTDTHWYAYLCMWGTQSAMNLLGQFVCGTYMNFVACTSGMYMYMGAISIRSIYIGTILSTPWVVSLTKYPLKVCSTIIVSILYYYRPISLSLVNAEHHFMT